MVFAHNMRAGGFESLVVQWRCIFWKFWMFETLKVWMFWKFGSTMVFTPNMRAAGFAALWMVVRLARWLVDTAPLNRWHMLVNGWHTGPTPFPKWFSSPPPSYFFIHRASSLMFSHTRPSCKESYWTSTTSALFPPMKVVLTCVGYKYLNDFPFQSWTFLDRPERLKKSLVVFGETLWIFSGFLSAHSHMGKTMDNGLDEYKGTRQEARRVQSGLCFCITVLL